MTDQSIDFHDINDTGVNIDMESIYTDQPNPVAVVDLILLVTKVATRKMAFKDNIG